MRAPAQLESLNSLSRAPRPLPLGIAVSGSDSGVVKCSEQFGPIESDLEGKTPDLMASCDLTTSPASSTPF
ncbi:hypothetical protein scyTo_0004769 [Scyliorhinus torazame]|uniref:Uncharacterized protein n=1 Tax=Scyliorhinus torazame TaxID=75743 RepID=A0A401NWW9_SCYTO|nr:hypothetical protein [Scyliorhinus torazame]